jgi:AmmeMemoRadiSam system protein A
LAPLFTPGLDLRAGCFVTLKTSNGDLRGCIGRIASVDQPLSRLVCDMAKAAAFSDSRFSPVTAKENETLIYDVTIMTPSRAVDNYKQIEIGKHGIILNKLSGGVVTNSAVFLPQVAVEQKWDLQTTLQQLSLKAGLDANAWKEECKFQVFEGFEIHE